MENIIKNDKETIYIQEVIDKQPFTKFHWMIFIISTLIIIADGYDAGAMGFIAPSLIKEWGIERSMLGPIFSAALFGMVFGALCAGPIADKLGRKSVVIVTTIIFGVFTFMSAFSEGLTEMMIYRFITGIGLGAAMPNIVTLLAEFMPRRIRALMVNAMLCAFPAGIALGGFLSAQMIPSYGWSSILIIGGTFPLIVVIFAIWLLPESMQYMVTKKRAPIKIIAILKQVANQEIQSDVSLEISRTMGSSDAIQKSALKLILSRSFILSTLFLWTACFMSLLMFYLLTSWLPTLLNDAGFEVKSSRLLTAIFPLGGVLGSLVIGYLMDRTNQDNIMIASYGLAAFLLVLTGVFNQSLWLFGLGIFLSGALITGAQVALPALTAGYYPTQGRATGVSWMHGMGRFGAIFGAFGGATLLKFNFSLAEIFVVLAIPAILASLALLVIRLKVVRITDY